MSTTDDIIQTINDADDEYLLINYIDNNLVQYYAFGQKFGTRSGHNYYDGAIRLGNCKVYVDATDLNTSHVGIPDPDYRDEIKEIKYSNMVKVVKVDKVPITARIYNPGTRNEITMQFNANGTTTVMPDTKGGKKYKKSKKQRKSKKSNKSKSKKNKNQRK